MARRKSSITSNSEKSLSFEHEMREICTSITQETEDLEKRNRLLISLKYVISADTDSLKNFIPEVWRVLKPPLICTLTDTRSGVVQEACNLLQSIARCFGDLMQPLIRELMPFLLRVAASGNTVIQEHVDQCLQTLIDNVRFPHQLKDISFEIKTSQSKELRAILASYVYQIIKKWPVDVLERDVGHLQAAITSLLEDGSCDSKEITHKAYVIFRAKWPRRGQTILTSLSTSMQSQLRGKQDIKAHIGGLSNGNSSREVYGRMKKRSLLTGSSRTNFCRSASPVRTIPILYETHTPPALIKLEKKAFSSGKQDLDPEYWLYMSPPTSNLSSPLYTDEEKLFQDNQENSNITEISSLALGDKVMVHGINGKSSGTVMFLGTTQFATGPWVGVELNDSHGKNDGTVKGIEYFRCPPNKGIFVRSNMIERCNKIEVCNKKFFHCEAAGKELLDAHRLYTKELLESVETELLMVHQFETEIFPNSRHEEKVNNYANALQQLLNSRIESSKSLQLKITQTLERVNKSA